MYSTTQGLDSDNIFVVKTFQKGDSAAMTLSKMRRELKGNMHAPSHDRIVPLLSAFQNRDAFFLLFPWASGQDLHTLWDMYPKAPSSDFGNRFSEKWLLDECLGIAGAVATIHGLHGHSHPDFVAQIHADIKPENILCFESPNPRESPFILKLADLGEASVIKQRKDSQGKTSQGARAIHTATYRPPEYDLQDLPNVVTLTYDVWCLGCFFLDFITWFLMGAQGVDHFQEARLAERDDFETRRAKYSWEDIFFKIRASSLFRRRSPSLSVEIRSEKRLSHGRAATEFSISFTASYRAKCRLKVAVLRVSCNILKHPLTYSSMDPYS